MDITQEDAMEISSPVQQRKSTFKEMLDVPSANTSFQSDSSPCPSPPPIDTRRDSAHADTKKDRSPSPRCPTPRIQFGSLLQNLPPSSAHETLKQYRRHLLTTCPIVGALASRVHAIVSWGGNLLSTLSLRPVVKVERMWLEDVFPSIYPEDDMKKRLSDAKIKARAQPKRECGFGVDPFEGVDDGVLTWRLEDVFDVEKYYGVREN